MIVGSMRNIRFRAWDTDLGEWCGADFYSVMSNGDFIIGMYGKNGELEPLVGYSTRSDGSKRFDVQQYTGLKDRNGVEIFEGDIVRYEHEILCQVKIGEYFNGKREAYGVFAEDIEDPRFTMYDPEDDFGKCEVIGNVYENPELVDN